VATDLLDAIFPHDPSVEVLETGYSGLLLVITSKSPLELAEIVSRRYPIRGLYALRPLLKWTLTDDPLSALRRLAEFGDLPRCRKLKVRVRGVKVSKGEIEDLFREYTKGGKSCTLCIEILGKLVGASLLVRPEWHGLTQS